jgi:hypothetical protein
MLALYRLTLTPLPLFLTGVTESGTKHFAKNTKQQKIVARKIDFK